MNKKILTATLILICPCLVSPASAKEGASPSGYQIQNQNQVQTLNQGEDQALEVREQEQESLAKEAAPRNENARFHMSLVAQKVEEILTTQGAKGGIGDQVREIARAQNQAQNQIKEELEKIETRSGFWKKIFGPNYQAIKNMEKLTAQNQLRIQQLEKLQNQTNNQAEATQIQEMIQALTDQNTALQEQAQVELQTKSLLGWFFKLFHS